MGLNKEQWAREQRNVQYLATMREGTDYSGFRERYRVDWVCRRCGLIVQAGRGHGHAR